MVNLKAKPYNLNDENIKVHPLCIVRHPNHADIPIRRGFDHAHCNFIKT